jgi:uncharacterized membrane protein
MEHVLILIAFALAVVAFARSGSARRQIEDLAARINVLEAEIRRLRRAGGDSASEREKPPAPSAEPVPGSAEPPPIPAPKAPEPLVAETAPTPAKPVPPPKPPPVPLETPAPGWAEMAQRMQPPAPAPVRPAINWEQFMGAKLFAWVGGLALFLGVGFFVKYSFDHDLIPPEMRVAIGFIIGIGLLIGGVVMRKKELAVTAQTLCGTGVLILYVSSFACHGFYHFPFFGVLPTFLLMALITAVAFLLAVRLEAPAVAILGLLGGFLTPILLSTGEDRPVGLFGYIALLNAGLLAVALHRRWHYLPPLGAAGTVIMQIGWAAKFFAAESYFEGNKVLIPMTILLGFVALFTAAAAWAKRRGGCGPALSWTPLGLAAVAFCFAFYFLGFAPLGQRPLLIFGYVFLVDLAVLAVALVEKRTAVVQPGSGMVVFALLATWTGRWLNDELLNAALALYLVFAIFHAAVPLALQRLRGVAVSPWWSHVFPAFALLLAMGPMLSSAELSLLFWPFVLLVDVLAVVVAAVTATLLPILFVLVLTLIVTGFSIGRIPETLTGLPTSLWMIGGFAVFFVVASAWAARRLKLPAGATDAVGKFAPPPQLAALLPSCSVVLPFLLLIMVVARLPITDPSPVFGLALLLIVLLLGLTKILAIEALPLVGLLSTLALEYAWHSEHFDPANPTLPLAWYLGFYAIFTFFPFLFRRDFAGKVLPWAAAALAGPLHFRLVHGLVKTAYPNQMMGLVPAAFAIPALLALVLLLQRAPAGSPARDSQLAWLGGAALFFITLIFPIQFDRQWITLGWALEGVALCWLFHRVPHPGLRVVGVALLVVAFVRLALNPAVLEYHPRSSTAIWNWYLYAYGIATACLFAGARLLAPPRNQVLGLSVPPLLYALGTVLAFLLVNIEIADYFTPAGAPVVTLEFSGNLARDMTYSMAWAMFALLLVIIGIGKKQAPVRYAGLGLLSITLLKLFFHDLSELDALYRIGALLVVAVVAIVASFLYQRFLSAGTEADETKNPPPSP